MAKKDQQETLEGLADEEDTFGHEPIAGTSKQLSFTAKFDKELKLDKSTLKVKVPAKGYEGEGEFQSGDTFEATVRVVVDRLEFKPIRDRYGNRIGVERIHHAVIDGLERNPGTE